MAAWTSYCLMLLLSVFPTTAWWFLDSGGSGKHSQAARDVDVQCEDWGRQGSCLFYDCFERRLPCGPEGYMRKYGGYYCHKMATSYGRFNKEGQQFLNNSLKCQTQRLLPLYRKQSLSCEQLSEAAFDDVSNCYVNSGFCSILWDNREALWGIYEAKHLFESSSLKVWRELLKVALQCGGGHITNFLTWATQKVNFFNIFG